MTSFRSILRVLMSAATALLLGTAILAQPASQARPDCTPKRVAPQDIPKEARNTLDYVRAHDEAPSGYVGGRRFGNYGREGEQKLPQVDGQGKRIDYREWDIHPKTPGRSRGAERLVTGSDGRAWYTADHYCTFTEIP